MARKAHKDLQLFAVPLVRVIFRPWVNWPTFSVILCMRPGGDLENPLTELLSTMIGGHWSAIEPDYARFANG